MLSERLNRAILRALRLDDFELTAETFAYEVPGWDSLSHVGVLCEVEKEFGIRFQGTEVVALENIGDLQALVDAKIAGREA